MILQRKYQILSSTGLARMVLWGILVHAAFGPVEAQGPAPGWDVTAARGRTRSIDFLTDEGTWMSVSLSPNQRWIVFDLLGHIYRVPVKGGEAECLTQNSGVALNFHPKYSPDGTRIAFVSDRAGQNNLWAMDADGSKVRAIFLDPMTRITEPTWTPEGDVIIAVRNFPTYSMHRRSARLWKFPVADGIPEELVGSPSGTQAYWPAVSPDGRYVYYQFATFAEPLHGVQRRQHIRRLDLHSGRVSPLTPGERRRAYRADGPVEMAPVLSPDGRWLAFARRIPGAGVSYRGHRFQRRTALWLMDLQTGKERILMDPITLDMADAHGMKNLRILPGYSWAGDSRSLVLSQGGKLRRVWLEDGRVETIPFRARVFRTLSEMTRSKANISRKPLRVNFPQWPSSSQDGKVLVFSAVGWIWRMNLPNGTSTRLTSSTSDLFEFMPVVSPDGKWVAFVTSDDVVGGHLWKVPVRGGASERLTMTPAEYLYPEWSPDGRSLLVTRRAEAKVGSRISALVRVPASGGPAEVVLESPVGPFTVGRNGRIYFRSSRPIGNIQALLAEGRTVPAGFVSLLSINGQGLDRKEYARFPSAQEVVPSPDAKWVAFRDNDYVFLASLRSSPSRYEGRLRWVGSEQAVEINPDDPRSKVKPVSVEGGIHPRWRNPTTLEFVSGSRYYAYDVVSGRLDTFQIDLRIPRKVPRGNVALTGARIVTLKNRQVIPQGTLVVERGRIACVGECSTAQADRVIDVSGATIIPGFVDVHAHHLSGGPLVPRHRYLSAIYLAYGVTTVLDPSPTEEVAFPVSELIETGRLVGPRTYSTGSSLHPISPKTGFRNYDETEDTIKRLASWGAISVKDYLQPRRDQHQMIAVAARKHGLSVTNEGADLLSNLASILDGHTGWEHPMMYVPLYDDATEFFGRSGAVYSATLAVGGAGYWSEEYLQSRGDLWNDPKQRRWVPWTRLARSINRAWRPIEEYSFPIIAEGVAAIARAGGHGALGGHGEQPGLDSHWEVWVYRSALEPMEALELASQGGAYMLGLEDDLGSIEAGKVADLIVLDSNPLDDIRNTTNIKYVMKGGVLYDGDTLDEIWPEERPYGAYPWLNRDVYRNDVRSIIDYWNQRSSP